MNGKVLIVGEKSADAKALYDAFKSVSHFVARLAGDKDLSTGIVLKFKPDLLIVDVNGMEPVSAVCARIQKEKQASDLPLVLLLEEALLARTEVPITVHDVFTKPVRAAECVARVLLSFKKIHRISDSHTIRAGRLEIDVTRYEVKIRGAKVDLTYTEYELLKFFASHPGQVFHRDALLNKVWGYDYFGGARTVDVHVRRLRAKIERTPGEFIETVRNIGYRFTAEEED